MYSFTELTNKWDTPQSSIRILYAYHFDDVTDVFSQADKFKNTTETKSLYPLLYESEALNIDTLHQ